MTDLRKLKVSLTKHGAHKIADIIKAFPRNKILDKTWGKYKGIKIDIAQAENNLSVSDTGIVPKIWDDIRKLGGTAIEDLVFIAIVFSHHDLIRAMIKGSRDSKKGVIERGKVLDGKAYTNFACILEELGISTYHSTEKVSYDLNRIFLNQELSPLVVELLRLKLSKADWDQKTDLIRECISLDFHKVFSVSSDIFKEWFSEGILYPLKELDDFTEEEPIINDFNFRKGHTKKKKISTIKGRKKAEREAILLHNKIQNKLYDYLVDEYGKKSVGTENKSGIGTLIDVVVKDRTDTYFYEIKTDKSVRKCIREALSQLIEYAYWPDRDIANKLIIVSPNIITNQAKTYLKHLRDKFGLPIYYQRFNLRKEKLEELN